MSDPQLIVDKILEVLAAAPTLKSVTDWFLGEPPMATWKGYPFGFVEWSGGAVTPGASKEMYQDAYRIVIVDRHVNADQAERSVMAFAKTIKDVLYADRTLGGLVETLWLTERAKAKIFDTKDYSIPAVGVTIRIRKRE